MTSIQIIEKNKSSQNEVHFNKHDYVYFVLFNIFCIYSMYYVAAFDEEESCEVIPASWLLPCKTKCYWPTTKFIRNLQKKCVLPEKKWRIIPCRVLSTAGK